VRILSTIYFGLRLHQLGAHRRRRPATRRDRVYAEFGPSRRLLALVALLWLLVLALLVNLVALTLRGLFVH
jgi:hypothetical protein